MIIIMAMMIMMKVTKYHSWLLQILWSRTHHGVHGLSQSENLYSRQVPSINDGQNYHMKFIIVVMMTMIMVIISFHPSSKDIFYELENLSEIKDRTILKLFETDGSGRGVFPSPYHYRHHRS